MRLRISPLGVSLLAAFPVAGWPQAPASQHEGRAPAPVAVEKLGLTYTLVSGGELYYSNDLLWKVWHDENAGQWRQDAFALLQATGWETEPYCGSKTWDQFRDVIRNGEAFLAAEREGPFLAETRLALARAYETWWSLSRAGDDPYVEPSPEAYEEGAEDARRKAIGLYRTFLQKESTAFRAWDARRRLERLVLGLDTNQRVYHCVWD